MHYIFANLIAISTNTLIISSRGGGVVYSSALYSGLYNNDNICLKC